MRKAKAKKKTILVTVIGDNFVYTDMATGLPAENLHVVPGDKLCWKVTVDGKRVNASVGFTKQGTPLTGNKTQVDVPNNAASGPDDVDTQLGSFPYIVTVEGGPSDDPTIEVDPLPDAGGCFVDYYVFAMSSGEFEVSQSRPAYAGDYIRWILNAAPNKLAFRVQFAREGPPAFRTRRRLLRSVANLGITRVTQLGEEGVYHFTLDLIGLGRRLEDRILVVNPAPPLLQGKPAGRKARQR